MSSTVSSPASTPSGARISSSNGPTRRQRVLWDSDSATRGGKTSIAILLEWLTAPGNYARWRDGKSQTGETRETLCSEIKSTMRQHGIHHRENANIRTQISELERSFDSARNWLKENDLHPYTFPHGPAETHVLRMCRYYHTLNEVFGHDEDQGLSSKTTVPSEDSDLHTQRMLAEAVREERERKRFCMEEERNKLECEKLRCEVEAAKLKLTIDRALARKKLLDAGLPEAQVDELFPK
ncbi:uncharacterized protein PITG_01727 [Phytophthora infestans T30-4]|uniref:Uncharacterized protein n=1 Tax=Phytophthora infestans (strain T30-4) TaxID=403677 RepID=D0MTY2_PHYIT|nr:uncharacterized protein PITG_01727 [Phytophthora infestans T30-4]EEY61429.1 conserved hypothetical protein [Phytophthora infestans T30-4]|eukprot:XP_002908346.1 conserved hypothetical protein [Phytophthora infestans T30-4]